MRGNINILGNNKRTIHTNGRTNYRRNSIHHKNTLKQLATKLLLGIFAIVLCILLSNLFVSKVDARGNAPVMHKHFGVIEVRYGETLWDYAIDYAYDQSYEDYIDEVIAINHIEGETIRSGEKIIVPFYSEEVY